MNRLLIILFSVAVLMACKKDDEPEMVQNHAPTLAEGLVGLHHDTYNVDAPQMLPGTYEMGARFSGSKLQQVTGGKLVQIQYYMMEKPASAQLRVYGQGTNEPDGPLLYHEDVLPEMQRNKWNVHHISDSVLIDSDEFWITLMYSVSVETKYLGCDPGPANPHGDWMWAMIDQEWKRFENRSGSSVNWNIRGVVSME